MSRPPAHRTPRWRAGRGRWAIRDRAAGSGHSAGVSSLRRWCQACEQLEAAFRAARADPGFRAGLAGLQRSYAGRPTPVTEATRLSEALGVRVLLKREDLAHTGSHKINNALGQGLLAQRIGKTALVAETGAGQHGVATATVAAHLGLGCTVYMGAKDIARQELNVFRMELLGAAVVPVTSGARTLKDATSEALRHWVTMVDSTHYCIGNGARLGDLAALVLQEGR
jgi:tryptophan synthase beta chain